MPNDSLPIGEATSNLPSGGMIDPAGSQAPHIHRRSSVPRGQPLKILRWVLTVAVVAGLAWAARSSVLALMHSPPDWKQVNGWWLAAAAGAMAGAQVLVGWFWRQILASSGHPRDPVAALRAFFFSQFGKYVPGKAMVIVLRSSWASAAGIPLSIGIGSVFLETLMYIAVGAGLGLGALAYSGAGQAWMNGVAWVMAMGVGLFTIPPVFERLERWLLGRFGRSGPDFSLRWSWELWFQGAVGLSASWLLQGLALAWILGALGPEPCEPGDYALCIATVCLATVVGFVTLVPGGLGVRELVILPLLAIRFSGPQALAAALVFRLFSICLELSVTTILTAWLGLTRKAHDREGRT